MILVVEDDRDIREVVCLFLDEGGYQTASASNGQEAIDWLRIEERPSLILLDLNMPVMDGYQFLAEKEADPLLADVPVVVMTATDDCSPLRKHRVCEWLPKPVGTFVLLAAIQRSARVANG